MDRDAVALKLCGKVSIGSRRVGAADDRAGTFLLRLSEKDITYDFVVINFGQHKLPEAATGWFLSFVIKI